MRLSILGVAGALLLALAGCNGTAPSNPLVRPNPTLAPASPQLYVSTVMGVLAYSLPIAAGQKPNFTIPDVADTSVIATDAFGDLAGVSYPQTPQTQVAYFSFPLSGGMMPSALFTSMKPQYQAPVLTFAPSSGTLFASGISNTGTSNVNAFTRPFSNASAPAFAVNTNRLVAGGGTFDQGGNLYLSNGGSGADDPLSVEVFTPPYTGAAAVVTPESAEFTATLPTYMAVSGNQLFVSAKFISGSPAVVAYALPLSNTSTPAYAIRDGLPGSQGISGMSIDPAGNLYVSSAIYSQLIRYAPPFSASSVPAATIQLGQPGEHFGGPLAIGPG
ncbi:MAG: hypothetical protein ACLQPV_04930 [Vulcanimicrobiaceae bacterium]